MSLDTCCMFACVFFVTFLFHNSSNLKYIPSISGWTEYHKYLTNHRIQFWLQICSQRPYSRDLIATNYGHHILEQRPRSNFLPPRQSWTISDSQFSKMCPSVLDKILYWNSRFDVVDFLIIFSKIYEKAKSQNNLKFGERGRLNEALMFFYFCRSWC